MKTSRSRLSADQVKHAAAGRVLDALVHVAGIPRDLLDGNHHPCPKCKGKDRFSLADPNAGAVLCRQCFSSRNGDFLSAIMWMTNATFPEAIKAAAGYLGIKIMSKNKPAKKRTGNPLDSMNGHANSHANGAANGQAREFPLADPVTRDRAYRLLLAELSLDHDHRKQLWQRGLTDDQIVAGIYRTLPDELPNLMTMKICYEVGNFSGVPGLLVNRIGGHPGLLIPVLNLDRQIVAIKVRSDDADDPKRKYSYLTSHSNRTPGVKADCAIHTPITTPLTCSLVRVTEGEIKANLAFALSGIPTISVPGVGMWERAIPVLAKMEATTVRLAFDADATGNKAVAQSLLEFSARLGKEGFAVEFERWPAECGKGIDDVLAGGHAEQIEILSGPAAIDAISSLADAAGVKLPNKKTKAANKEKPNNGRPEILIDLQEHDIADQAITTLVADTELFQRSGTLVRVIHDIDPCKRYAVSTSRIIPLNHATLREKLTRVASFVKERIGEDGEPELVPVSIPRWLVEAVHARGKYPGIHTIRGLATAPFVRADGTICNKLGFDAESGLYLCESMDIQVPDSPDTLQITQATELILGVVADFPFAAPVHRSAWLAGLLTPLVRSAFDGPAPLLVIDGNTPGCGKSLAASIISIIVSGTRAIINSAPKSDEDFRKLITSIAIAGSNLVFLDNLGSSLGCQSLDAALTSTSWSDRVLGANTKISLPLLATWFATGNNVSLASDTSRRVYHCRFESLLENPEERENFQQPNLIQHVQENRPALLTAALTIVRGFYAAGQPRKKLKSWGSFEGWSDCVRQIICWLGLEDPIAGRTELVKSADQNLIALAAVLANWSEVDPDCLGITAAELVDRLHAHPNDTRNIREALAEMCAKGGKFDTGKVGGLLRSWKGKVCGGKFLDRKTGRSRINYWLVISTESDTQTTSVDTQDTNTTQDEF